MSPGAEVIQDSHRALTLQEPSVNLSSILILTAVGLMSGCSATFHLYPVQGTPPVSAPLPVLTAELRGPGIGRGTLVITLPGGETCTGPWAHVLPGAAASGPGEEADLSTEWDRVYGPGYYVANVLGAHYRGRGVVKGGQGMIFHLEFYRNEVERSPTLGVATDGQGNLYKVSL